MMGVLVVRSFGIRGDVTFVPITKKFRAQILWPPFLRSWFSFVLSHTDGQRKKERKKEMGVDGFFILLLHPLAHNEPNRIS